MADVKKSRLWRWTVFIVRNIVGAIVVLAGLFLSIPFIPGPGVLMIVVGLAIMDFPGRDRLLGAIKRKARQGIELIKKAGSRSAKTQKDRRPE